MKPVAKMYRRAITVATLLALLLLLAACEDAPQTARPTPSPYTGYLTEEIPPCTPVAGSSVDPCQPRGPIETFGAAGGTSPAFYTDDPLTIRQFLNGSSLSYIPHVVLRGAYIADTGRCTSGNPNRDPSYVEPGYFQHSILIECYADVRVSGYILGNGPAQLTVLVTFHHYWEGYYAGGAPEIGIETEEEFVEEFRQLMELALEMGGDFNGEGIYDREVILFVGTPHNYATEVWEVFETWYVERRRTARSSPSILIETIGEEQGPTNTRSTGPRWRWSCPASRRRS